MTIINTDGMALIGPGSEWFWTALSGVVLAGTFLAIYRQLRLQRSEGAIGQINGYYREWDTERFLSYQLSVLTSLRDGTDPGYVPSGAAGSLANFWESIGTLAREGHIDRRLIWDVDGNSIQVWWAFLAPHCRRQRETDRDPAIYENFEWLAGVMNEMDRRAGSDRTFEEMSTAAALDARIASIRERLQVERSLRTVIVAPSEPVTGHLPQFR